MKVTFISSMNAHNDIRIYRKFILSLSKYYDVTYYYSSDDENVTNQENITFVNLGKPHSKIHRIIKLVKTIKEVKSSDVFIVTNPELLLILPILRKKFPDSSIFFDMHEDFEESFQDKSKKFGKIMAKIYLWILDYLIKHKILNFIFVTTPLINKKFAHYNNVEIIENYAPLMNLEFDKYKNPNDGMFEMLFHGSISQIRGIDILLQSLPELDNVRLHLVGNFNGNYKKIVYQRIRELNIENKVIIKDSMNYLELFEYMKKMHVGIISYLPYKNHLVTRPNKLFEYMAASLPIICSNFPLYREVVNERCGLTYNPESKEEFIKCVNTLRNNTELYNQFRLNGYKDYVKKFNWSIEENKLIKIITNGGKSL
ncbi:glycosyltransferase [Macrococcoides canis]|uniref:glycosyltransferase n=1 Tax=Macrococcoides canis TaxID=1855823 RepID=UPI00106055DA|nr:glycosyltransferase [Macrococcus canis]TDM32446.1 glycosyltransferase [Macrococcus canis]